MSIYVHIYTCTCNTEHGSEIFFIKLKIYLHKEYINLMKGTYILSFFEMTSHSITSPYAHNTCLKFLSSTCLP